MRVQTNRGLRLVAAGWMTLLAGPGCGSRTDQTVDMPFAPATTADAPPTAPVSGSPSVLFLPPAGDDQHAQVWQRSMEGRGGFDKVLLEVRRPAPGDPPNQQTKLLEQAAASGAKVVIVAPQPGAPGEGLSAAAEAAAKQGVRIVAIERPLADPQPNPPAIFVGTKPLDALCAELVAGIVEKAAKSPDKHLDKGPVLILRNDKGSGPWAQERADALRAALEKAGLPIAGELTVSSPGDAAREAIIARYKEPNAPKIYLALDIWSLRSAISARRHLDDMESVLIAGFADDSDVLDALKQGMLDVAVDYNNERMGGDAVHVAAEILAGKKVPPRIEIPAEVRLAPRAPVKDQDLNQRRAAAQKGAAPTPGK